MYHKKKRKKEKLGKKAPDLKRNVRRNVFLSLLALAHILKTLLKDIARNPREEVVLVRGLKIRRKKNK